MPNMQAHWQVTYGRLCWATRACIYLVKASSAWESGSVRRGFYIFRGKAERGDWRRILTLRHRSTSHRQRLSQRNNTCASTDRTNAVKPKPPTKDPAKPQTKPISIIKDMATTIRILAITKVISNANTTKNTVDAFIINTYDVAIDTGRFARALSPSYSPS